MRNLKSTLGHFLIMCSFTSLAACANEFRASNSRAIASSQRFNFSDDTKGSNSSNSFLQENIQRKSDLLFSHDFESNIVGDYLQPDLAEDFEEPLWNQGFYEGPGDGGFQHFNRTYISNAGNQNGQALEVRYTQGQAGPGAGAQFPLLIPGDHEELYLSYQVQFRPGFQFVRGGKLPGLCGYRTDRDFSTGCKTGGARPNADEGFSARVMWRENGAAVSYMYYPGQPENFGEDLPWGVNFQPGAWHTIEQRVRLNTVGLNDGIIEVWVDGQMVYGKYDMVYRQIPEIKINAFYFSTFFGGGDASWAPSSEQAVYFDNFAISTQRIDP